MMKLLSETYIKQADAAMHKAALKLAAKILIEEPDRVEVDNIGNILCNGAVTVDGTWQRHGHCSKICVVFIISISTGEVLDYVVKSLFCHQCSFHQKNLQTNAYNLWYEEHRDNCCINHSGSSDSMEKEGAKEIFLRSIDKYNLKYW